MGRRRRRCGTNSWRYGSGQTSWYRYRSAPGATSDLPLQPPWRTAAVGLRHHGPPPAGTCPAAPVAEERPPLFLRHLGHLFTLLRGQAAIKAARRAPASWAAASARGAAVNHGHLGAFAQAVDAIGHHLVTVLQFTLHAHAVAVHHPHECAAGSRCRRAAPDTVVVLHRRAGHREHVFEQVDLRLHVDELVGKRAPSSLAKAALALMVPVVASMALSSATTARGRRCFCSGTALPANWHHFEGAG